MSQQLGAIDLNRLGRDEQPRSDGFPAIRSNCTARKRSFLDFGNPARVAVEVNGRYLRCCAVGLLILTSCATVSRHQFAQPTPTWELRTGQLLYRTSTTTLIGEVFVRFSRQGDFELSFSKGPGITLLTLRQDGSFAEVRGAMAGPGWSGPVEHAPNRLRSWLALRDRLVRSQNQKTIRYVAGPETFVFRF
jgi:hypothetical protein